MKYSNKQDFSSALNTSCFGLNGDWKTLLWHSLLALLVFTEAQKPNNLLEKSPRSLASFFYWSLIVFLLFFYCFYDFILCLCPKTPLRKMMHLLVTQSKMNLEKNWHNKFTATNSPEGLTTRSHANTCGACSS